MNDPSQDEPVESKTAELTQQTEEAAKRARAQAEALTKDAEERLAAIDRRVKSAKSSYNKAKTNPEDHGSSLGGSSARGLAFGLAIATSIIGLPIGGFAIGWLIELQGGDPQWKLWLGGGGAVLGIAHGAWLASKVQRD
jgi:hypothetical protein